MKNFLTMLALVSSFSAVSAFAEVEVAPSRCDLVLRLSDSQKLEIKEITKASAEKLLSLGKEIRAAKAASDKVLAKVEASKEEATAAANALTVKIAEVQAVKHAEKLAVLFDVLTPEQRIKKVKCEQAPRRHVPTGRIQNPRAPRLPHGPGRIERFPSPHHRPGRVIISRPAPHGPSRPVPAPYSRPRRGGIGHPQV